VARREDNDMINGTKLLNVAGMTRGRRDGILKTEKQRHVVKIGAMHLKGVWIPFDRALAFANKEGIADMLYPLFVSDIKSLLYYPGGVPPQGQAASGVGQYQQAASTASYQQRYLPPLTSLAPANAFPGPSDPMAMYQQQKPLQQSQSASVPSYSGTQYETSPSYYDYTRQHQQQVQQQQPIQMSAANQSRQNPQTQNLPHMTSVYQQQQTATAPPASQPSSQQWYMTQPNSAAGYYESGGYMYYGKQQPTTSTYPTSGYSYSGTTLPQLQPQRVNPGYGGGGTQNDGPFIPSGSPAYPPTQHSHNDANKQPPH
jgi:protein SOK2